MTPPTAATPREVVERYNHELWNQRRLELAEQLIGQQVVRHEVGSVHTLSRAEATDRVRGLLGQVRSAHFTLLRVIAEGELVTIVYQCELVTEDGTEDSIASIEVFRVVDGRIVEVWNNPHSRGRWL